MLKPDFGFEERDLSQFFVLTVPANAGALITLDSTDTAVIGVGDTPYGNVIPGSVSVAGDRELGVLFYDVTSTGPSFFEQVVGILDLSTKVGMPAAIWHTVPGDILSTDAYDSTAITAGAASGNTAQGTLLGIKNGVYTTVQGSGAGSVPRAKLIGNAVQNSTQLIRVQVV